MLGTVGVTVIEDVIAPRDARHASMVVAKVHNGLVLGLMTRQAHVAVGDKHAAVRHGAIGAGIVAQQSSWPTSLEYTK